MLPTQSWTGSLMTLFVVRHVPPNIHIDVFTDLYLFLRYHPEHRGIYNAGFENLSIMEIARQVTEQIPAEIVTTPSNDPRSYRVNSDKLLNTGFSPKKTVADAIREIVVKFQRGELKNEDRHYNLRWMQREVMT